MDALAFEHHLTSPQGLHRHPDGGYTVTADGGACGDRIRFTVAVKRDIVTDAGFDASGCGAASAAASAAVTLIRGRPLLEAARIATGQIEAELGGLNPAKRHAAELAADALARSLGGAAQQHASLTSEAGRTLIAMSGGVDSAVAALLCADGADTTDRPARVAVTLELWSDSENDPQRSCCSASAVAQARGLAHSMGLAHFTIDLRERFRQGVVEPFIAGYAAGETPNPCVGCNGHVRLDAMLELADRLGAQRLATGHYARIAERHHTRGPLLRQAADPDKDQTYMLAALPPASLARMRFPLGELTKPQVRELAAQRGLPVAAKPDSQDLCFLAGTDRGRFLARHGGLEDRPGVIVDRDGTILGRHAGQHRFTVGQRRGLGVGGRGDPLYVLDKDAGTGRLLVGSLADLGTDRVSIRAARLHRAGARVDRVKLRSHAEPLRARLLGRPPAGLHGSLALELLDQADAAAPGQLACLMDGELVVGWGTIARPHA